MILNKIDVNDSTFLQRIILKIYSVFEFIILIIPSMIVRHTSGRLLTEFSGYNPNPKQLGYNLIEWLKDSNNLTESLRQLNNLKKSLEQRNSSTESLKHANNLTELLGQLNNLTELLGKLNNSTASLKDNLTEHSLLRYSDSLKPFLVRLDQLKKWLGRHNNLTELLDSNANLQELLNYPTMSQNIKLSIFPFEHEKSKFHITVGDLYARGSDIEVHQFAPPKGQEIKGNILYRHGLGSNCFIDFEPVILNLVKSGYRVFSWDNLGVADNTGATKDFATSLNVGRQISKHIIEDIIDKKGGKENSRPHSSPIIFMGCSLGGYEMLNTAKYIENEFKGNEKYRGRFKLIDYHSFSSVKDIFMRKQNIKSIDNMNYISKLFNFLFGCIILILNFFFMRINGNAKDILKDLEMPVLVINIQEDNILKGGILSDVLDSDAIKDKKNISSILLEGDNHCSYELNRTNNLVKCKNIDLNSCVKDTEDLLVSTDIEITKSDKVILPISFVDKFITDL